MDVIKVGMNLESKFILKGIEGKVLNGRKVNIKAMLEAQIKIYSNENVEFIKQINDINDIQLLNKNFKISCLVGSGTTKVFAKDTVIIDNIDNLAEIMKVDINISNKDIKISYNKVLAKADAIIKLLYITEDNRINSVNATIPIMGFIDIQDISDDNLCDVQYELKNLIVKPNSVDEHSVYVEAEIEISCNVYENKDLNIIQDLYSPSKELSFQKQKITTMQEKQYLKDLCSIREKQYISEIQGNRIYDVDVKPIIINKTILTDRISYEGEINLTFMFATDMTTGIDTKNIIIPFNFNMVCNGVNSNSNVSTDIEVAMQDFVVMPDESIDIKIDLNFNVNISNTAQINIISEINEEENRILESCSVVIYFVKPGDTLWHIAKEFKSTVENIAKMNDIEDVDKIDVGQQLFIPRCINSKGSMTA